VGGLRFFLTWLLLAGSATFLIFSFPFPARSSVEAEPTAIELDGCTAAESMPVSFHLINHSSQSLPILGLRGACGSNCCFRVNQGDMAKVPPGRSKVDLLVRPVAEGSFDAEVSFYVEDHGLREIRVSIRGMAKNR